MCGKNDAIVVAHASDFLCVALALGSCCSIVVHVSHLIQHLTPKTAVNTLLSIFPHAVYSTTVLRTPTDKITQQQENKRLSEPLTVALTDVAELHAHLRGQEKDRMSLANAKARLRVIDEQVRLCGNNSTDIVTHSKYSKCVYACVSIRRNLPWFVLLSLREWRRRVVGVIWTIFCVRWLDRVSHSHHLSKGHMCTYIYL